MLFRVTFTVGHKCVQEFALFILSEEKVSLYFTQEMLLLGLHMQLEKEIS